MAELLPQNSKKGRGRPKQRWTQADTARELGISQQAVSKSIRIAKAVEAMPELAKFGGNVILKAITIIKHPDDADWGTVGDKEREAMNVIFRALGLKAQSK